MIDITHIATACLASAAVVTVAVLMYRYHVQKLSTPVPKARMDYEGAITQLQDTFDASGRAHVQRCDELDDSLEALKRAHDKQLYDLEQQVMRLTNERETEKATFKDRMKEVDEKANRLSQLLSTRLPLGRMG